MQIRPAPERFDHQQLRGGGMGPDDEVLVGRAEAEQGDGISESRGKAHQLGQLR
jgi:hypothetical protein